MVILRLITLFVLFWLQGAHASEFYKAICIPKEICDEIQLRIDNSLTKGEPLISELQSIALDKGIEFLMTKEVDVKDVGVVTYVFVKRKSIIKNLSFNAIVGVDVDQIEKISQLQEGAYFDAHYLADSQKQVSSWLSDRGYLEPKVKYELKFIGDGQVNIVGEVSYKEKLILNEIDVTGEKNILTKELLRPVKKLEGNPYSKVSVKLILDQVLYELKKEGYFGAKIELEERRDTNLISLMIKLTLGPRTQFSFYGNKALSKDELSLKLKKSIENGTSILRPEDLVQVIKEMYTGLGLFNTKISYEKRKGQNFERNNIETYFFNIEEGKKSRLDSLSFKGNLKVGIDKLKEIYYENASVLALRDYVDRSYLENFSLILKNYYLERGFVFIEVSKPRISFDNNKANSQVSYSVKERQQCSLDKINLIGVPKDAQLAIKKTLKNQAGKPLNVVELENDLSRALNSLRSEGYFYASIENLNDNNVVTYSSNYTRSEINLKFKPGKKTKFENVILAGNQVTKDKVLLREITLGKGELLTPVKIKNIRDRVNSLGLFARVQVIPLVTNKLSNDTYNKTNLIIQVQEKQFGRGEIAPGYRTDIGAKISLTLTKSNLLGLNDSGTLKFQLNRRFRLSQFDQRRSSSGKHRIEGLGRISYSFPYLLDFADFTGNFSIQRRRFYAFDADIYRISPQFSKKVNDFLGLSLKYQYERIRQFDATLVKDRATFEIGSITPSITLDFRDNTVSPRKGAYFGLSWEFANPYFGSQDDEEIEINFSKVISRNRFYIPITSKSFVLAMSLSVGMQKNYATDLAATSQTRGYIPSIKVFRLDGLDVVRGFADREINRLDDGQDISQRRVDNKAFFANFKFEPRFYVNDSFIVGPFMDAGRVFINKFKPLDLRTSAGLTFKFLTPVGTLDFDYGVKLKRRRLNGQARESFGRFHLSIGYF